MTWHKDESLLFYAYENEEHFIVMKIISNNFTVKLSSVNYYKPS